MTKTEWKSAEEIEHSLKDCVKVTILSCGLCANLCGTGGKRGMKFFRGFLRALGKDVVAAKCLVACCPEEAMRGALTRYRRQIQKSDALVVMSCAAGVKSAFLCDTGIPVIAVLDTLGSVPVTVSQDPVGQSICSSCGHCVITYTGGICPRSACPAKKLYEPCNQFDRVEVQCLVNPELPCIWKKIAERCDLEKLKELGRIQEEADSKRLTSPDRKRSSAGLRKISGWVLAHSTWFSRFVHLIH